MGIIDTAKYFYKGLKEQPKYLYSKEETEMLEQYVKEHLGEYTKVYHELYSPDIHLDILVIPPSEESNYYKLITVGMGAYKMNVPDIIEDNGLDRAELVMYLSPDWDLNFSKEENGWIIRELKRIARTPIMENSWVGYGHTFAESAEANKPLSNNSKFTSTILLPTIDENNHPLCLPLFDNKLINFYQVVPLYKEELDYRNNNGVRELLELVDHYRSFLIVDVNRKNCCKTLELEQEEDIDLEKLRDAIDIYCENCLTQEWNDLLDEYAISDNENYMGEVRENLEDAVISEYESVSKEKQIELINKLSKYNSKEIEEEIEK